MKTVVLSFLTLLSLSATAKVHCYQGQFQLISYGLTAGDQPVEESPEQETRLPKYSFQLRYDDASGIARFDSQVLNPNDILTVLPPGKSPQKTTVGTHFSPDHAIKLRIQKGNQVRCPCFDLDNSSETSHYMTVSAEGAGKSIWRISAINYFGFLTDLEPVKEVSCGR